MTSSESSGTTGAVALQESGNRPISRWSPLFVFLFGFVVLLPSIWSETSVTGSDEYSLGLRTPMEMADRGEWLTPWVNGEPRLRKPPLVYWLILATYHAAGVSLWAARIWGVLAGAGLGVVSCLTSRELLRNNGFLAGLITVSCIGVAAQARQAMLDLPLAFWISAAVLFWLQWYRSGRITDATLSGACLGLSFLTKGPVGLFFFSAAVVAGLWKLPRQPSLRGKNWHWAVALLVFLGVSTPWPLAIQRIWSDRFGQIIGEELAARNFGRWHGMAPLSALGGALGLIAPWTPMVLVAMWRQFRRDSDMNSHQRRWLTATVFLSVLPFFFMATFERNMLAVVPVQAVLAADWLESGDILQRLTLRIAASLLAAVALAASCVAFWFHLGPTMALITGLVALTLLWGAWNTWNPGSVVAAGGIVFALVFGGLYPGLGLNYLPPDIESQIGRRPAFAYDRLQPAMLSPRLGHSIQPFRVDRVPPDGSAIVFVDGAQRADLEKQLHDAGLSGVEFIRFKTFYSRKAWARFARADATTADWREAFRNRSLDHLRTDMIGIEVNRNTQR